MNIDMQVNDLIVATFLLMYHMDLLFRIQTIKMKRLLITLKIIMTLDRYI
jgi:hypothetical protein